MSVATITLDDITSADWSLMLDSSSPSSQAGSGIGDVVQGVDDINQCVGIILGTPKGSDPLRPAFGCDLWRFIDMPVDRARPHLVREIVEAVTRWEPRVKVLSVLIRLVELNQLSISVTWQLKIDLTGVNNQRVTLTVPRTVG